MISCCQLNQSNKIKSKFSFFIISLFLLSGTINAVSDPLPSWNEGATKESIINFVKEVTDEGSKNYIPPKNRIATFDEDGTLWVEQPLYAEFFFALETIKSLAPEHPELANKEPFKSILSGDADAIKNLNEHDMEQLIGITHSGMTLDEFHQRVNDWLKKATHPRFKKPFTDLVYQPMLEAMQLLRDNQFLIFIASGGGQEFIRVFAEQLYGTPPGHIIGTTGKVKYEYRDGHPVLIKLPEVLFVDVNGGKPEGINLIIGQRPVIAFGNSTGDQQMLEWTQGNKGKTLELLVHHDDPVREYAYGPDSKIGTFSVALMDEAKKQNWKVISMKNDWKVIFPWEKIPTTNK